MCVYIIFFYYTTSILLVFALFSMIIDYDCMSRAFLRRLWRPDNWVMVLFKKAEFLDRMGSAVVIRA